MFQALLFYGYGIGDNCAGASSSHASQVSRIYRLIDTELGILSNVEVPKSCYNSSFNFPDIVAACVKEMKSKYPNNHLFNTYRMIVWFAEYYKQDMDMDDVVAWVNDCSDYDLTVADIEKFRLIT